MKQMRVYLFLVLLLVLAGCKRSFVEDDIKEEGARLITARLEVNDVTKTVLSGPVEGIYYPFWSKDDALAVYVDDVSLPDKYTLTDGAGTVEATFKGKVSGMRLIALFPHSFFSKEGWKNNVLTLELPDVQLYKEGSFGEDAYPMVAYSTTNDLSFKNLCAVLKVSMTGESMVQSIRFVSHDDKMSVSGKGTVKMDYSAEPELVMAEGGRNEVKLQCDGVQLNKDIPTEFFIVIPPGTYKRGFSLEIKTYTGSITKSTDADVTFCRSQLRAIPTFECTTSGTIDPDSIPSNQIWYKTTYDSELWLGDDSYFDKTLISNEFINGWYIATFDGPLKRVGTNDGYASLFWLASEVRLPDTVEEIGNGTFQCPYLKSFRTPDNLKKVGYSPFQACQSLERIYGKWASGDEKALVLEDGSLVAYALASLDAELVIPEGVKKIVGGTFSGRTSLESVTLPSSLEDMEEDVFYGCPNLREFKGESALIYDAQTLVSKNKTLIAFAGKGVVDYAIPSGVSLRTPELFGGFEDLRSVTIPGSLGTITTGLFRGSSNLEFFYGPNISDDHHCWTMDFIDTGKSLWSLTPVCPVDYTLKGIDAIITCDGNKAIERLTLDDKITYVSSYAFQGMDNLRYLRMPSSLSTLGDDAFYACMSLDSLFLRSFAPPSYSDSEEVWARWGTDNLVIYVPKGFEDRYREAPGWSKYAGRIQGYQYDDLEDPDYYMSSDYSHDGEVTILQTATEGSGIELVLMGDAYSDRQIADGTYDAAMRKMMAAFFSEEPYATYKNLFNVSMVTVVSTTEGYDNGGQALGTWFGGGTQVGGNNERCIEYAKKSISEEKIDNAVIIVAMNVDTYAGTCYMFDQTSGDYGNGLSIAYFPTSSDESTFNGLVRHEAGGHGFAKLGDEYAYDYMGQIPEAEVSDANYKAKYGWWKNVDFTGDPSKVKWAKFLNDDRYQFDGLGVFEGAFTYWTGAWRPTDESIMNHNIGGFNAPSREAIWYRIHKLAYGDNWEYNYEDFVAYDAKNRKTAAATKTASPNNYVERRMEPTHPPVLMNRRWNDPAPERKYSSDR